MDRDQRRLLSTIHLEAFVVATATIPAMHSVMPDVIQHAIEHVLVRPIVIDAANIEVQYSYRETIARASMAIKKQEFYEGAALHLLARSGLIRALRYEPPFFLLNDSLSVLLKYSTRNRSPWGFTFTVEEQRALSTKAAVGKTTIGLVCGADGVASLCYNAYLRIATLRNSALHIACYRKRGGHYEVVGPDGPLARKVPPANWQRLLFDGDAAHEPC